MTFYDIFRQLNDIPRPSHHEEKVADFLCSFAQNLGLEYERDAQNCVVIRKPATPGYEDAEPVVLLNHMDMVAVSDGTTPFDPLNDGIKAYIEDGWMKAHGTSLGADNGIGLSMALAVLADDTIQHPPLEVLTTTNEEDGMSGAANLSTDFIRGRKVINLDSEDYDTITVGAAGAYLQVATFPIEHTDIPDGLRFLKITVSGGQGGHSGVDINKGRINAIKCVCSLIQKAYSYVIAEINGGSANASIPGNCYAVIGIPESDVCHYISEVEKEKTEILKAFADTDSNINITIDTLSSNPSSIILYPTTNHQSIITNISSLPCGPLRMHDEIPGTVMTSNNIGVIKTLDNAITVSCHTRSFSDKEMVEVAEGITRNFKAEGAEVEVFMNTPGWQENQHSDFMHLVDETFHNTLGFYPRKVAMHFVLEAGYYVQKYPGIEIACIGPRIIEPHSTNERLEISTADDIWKVLVKLLKELTIKGYTCAQNKIEAK